MHAHTMSKRPTKNRDEDQQQQSTHMPRKYTRDGRNEEKSKTFGALNSTRINAEQKETPYTHTLTHAAKLIRMHTHA